jgi:SAM-dependent methyltransferase
VLCAIADFVLDHGTNIDVYACESISPFAKRLRKIFQSRFVGSEYLPTSGDLASHPGIHHEDIQSLSFADESFDLYVNCEVLEHIPNVDKALSEAFRVLRPTGLFVGTVPFAYNSEKTVVRSRLVNGAVEHLMSPEYHGNPADPSRGSLVFEVPGWNILDRLRSAGFKDAMMRFIATRYGISGAEIAGIFVFLQVIRRQVFRDRAPLTAS